MADVDGSRRFDVTSDELWAVVTDPARLPDWVPTMRAAEPSGRSEVHLEGESHGHPYSLTGLLAADEVDRRLDWGSPGDEGYGGSLRVLSQPPGSKVHIHLAVPDDHLASDPDAVAEIQRGIEEALDRLAGLVAG